MQNLLSLVAHHKLSKHMVKKTTPLKSVFSANQESVKNAKTVFSRDINPNNDFQRNK
jgi:hypothetical protein